MADLAILFQTHPDLAMEQTLVGHLLSGRDGSISMCNVAAAICALAESVWEVLFSLCNLVEQRRRFA
jgi:hypothetical protein